MTPEEIAALKLRDTELTTKTADLTVKTTELTLTLKERDTKIAELEKANKELKDAEEKRLASDRNSEVSEAIAAYGKSKGLQESDREDLLALLTANEKSFRKLYPKVDPAKRLLTSTVSDSRGSEAPRGQVDGTGTPEVKVNLRDAAKELARKKGIPLAQAQQLLLKQSKG